MLYRKQRTWQELLYCCLSLLLTIVSLSWKWVWWWQEGREQEVLRVKLLVFSVPSLNLCLSFVGCELILQSDKWKKTGHSQEVAINIQQYAILFRFSFPFIHPKLPQHILPYRMERRTVYAKQMYLFPLKKNICLSLLHSEPHIYRVLHCLQPDFKYLLLMWLKNNAIRWQAILHRFSLRQYFTPWGKALYVWLASYSAINSAGMDSAGSSVCRGECRCKESSFSQLTAMTYELPNQSGRERKEKHSTCFQFCILSKDP